MLAERGRGAGRSSRSGYPQTAETSPKRCFVTPWARTHAKTVPAAGAVTDRASTWRPARRRTAA